MLVHTPKDLAAFIESQRKTLNLSQTQVAELVGLKQKTISAFENKPESTRLDTLFRILAAINLNIGVTSRDKKISKKQWKQEW